MMIILRDLLLDVHIQKAKKGNSIDSSTSKITQVNIDVMHRNGHIRF